MYTQDYSVNYCTHTHTLQLPIQSQPHTFNHHGVICYTFHSTPDECTHVSLQAYNRANGYIASQGVYVGRVLHAHSHGG